jgi:hypothetical protein
MACNGNRVEVSIVHLHDDSMRRVFCFFSEGFFSTWTNYQDMRTGLFALYCAICASGGFPI